jgi:RecB family exonuclease
VFEAAISATEHRLIGLPVLLLDLVPRSTIEADLVAMISSRSREVLATAAAGEPEDLARMEAALGVRASITGLGLGLGSEVPLTIAEVIRPQPEPEPEPQLDRTLDRVRSYVFSLEAPPVGEPDPSFELFSAPGEAREAVEIARRIKRLAATGVAFDRMAILLRTADAYQLLIADALRRAQIPGFFTHGTKRPDPAGRALLLLLACAAEGLTASRFAEYLSLGQLPQPASDGGPPKKEVPWVAPKNDLQLVFTEMVDMTEQEKAKRAHLPVPMQWEQLLVDAAVIGGRNRWVRRLRGLEAELSFQAEGLRGEDEVRIEKKLADLTALRNLRRFALPIIEFLGELPARAIWRTWLERLRKLACMALANPEAILRVLAELEPLGEVGPVGLDEVRDVLAERLSFLREEPDEHRFGRVFVGTLDESAGRTFEAVFIPGLAEGMFPKKSFEDPLLLDVHRERLKAELSRRPDRIREERARLHRAIGAAEERLVISYPRMDVNTGRPRVPSLFALEVLRAAEGRLPDLASLEARAAEAADARLGWPAPSRAEDAIDDAEYDLSVLGPLLFQPPEAVRGRGRYLIEDSQGRDRNDCLVRALRAQASRWRSAWTSRDGLLAPGQLSDQRLFARSYSPTSLQSFAACPYRFHLHAILRLRPREQVAALEELDPLTRGLLFHSVQFRLFGALRSRNLHPVKTEELERVFAVLDETIDRVEAEYQERLAPAIPQVWKRQIESMRAELRRWLRQVAEKDADWMPIHAELAFGLPDDTGERDPQSHPDAVQILERWFVRGSIDLVEQNLESGLLRITDHKTGKPAEKRPAFVGGGEALQPLIYALAIEGIMNRGVDSGRLYYCTPRGGYERVDISVTEEARARIAQVMETIDRSVEAGFLPAAPREGACAWCDYRAVCGPNEELRVGRKAIEGLEPLIALRGMR